MRNKTDLVLHVQGRGDARKADTRHANVRKHTCKNTQPGSCPKESVDSEPQTLARMHTDIHPHAPTRSTAASHQKVLTIYTCMTSHSSKKKRPNTWTHTHQHHHADTCSQMRARTRTGRRRGAKRERQTHVRMGREGGGRKKNQQHKDTEAD